MKQANWLRTSLWGILALVVAVAVYAWLVRPAHMRWGATDVELAMALPVDPYITPAQVVSTRAVTIEAPISTIWPWVLQLGQGRGGFYSYDWLENLFAADMHNVDHIIPELQNTTVGTQISLMHNGPYAVVSRIDPEQNFIMDQEWILTLMPVDEDTTRLVVRYAFEPGTHPLGRYYYWAIFEPAHFVMETGMMMGIKERAERQAVDATPAGMVQAMNDGGN